MLLATKPLTNKTDTAESQLKKLSEQLSPAYTLTYEMEADNAYYSGYITRSSALPAEQLRQFCKTLQQQYNLNAFILLDHNSAERIKFSIYWDPNSYNESHKNDMNNLRQLIADTQKTTLPANESSRLTPPQPATAVATSTFPGSFYSSETFDTAAAAQDPLDDDTQKKLLVILQTRIARFKEKYKCDNSDKIPVVTTSRDAAVDKWYNIQELINDIIANKTVTFLKNKIEALLKDKNMKEETGTTFSTVCNLPLVGGLFRAAGHTPGTIDCLKNCLSVLQPQLEQLRNNTQRELLNIFDK